MSNDDNSRYSVRRRDSSLRTMLIRGGRTLLFRGGCCGINSVESRRTREREQRKRGRKSETASRPDGATESGRERERARAKTKGDSLVLEALRRSRSGSLASPLRPSLSRALFSPVSLVCVLSLASRHPYLSEQPQKSMHPGSLLPAANDPTFLALLHLYFSSVHADTYIHTDVAFISRTARLLTDSLLPKISTCSTFSAQYLLFWFTVQNICKLYICKKDNLLFI